VSSQGHSVLLLEKLPKLKPLGDIISFSSNLGRIFQRWEGIEEELDPVSHKSDGIDFTDWHRTFITRQTWEKEASYGKRINGHVVKSMRSSSTMRRLETSTSGWIGM
jgi:hypothetical protein